MSLLGGRISRSGIIESMAAESIVSVVEERGEREAPSRRVQLLADGTLVGMTLVWGCSFVLVKDIVAVVPPMLWLAVRFAFGALALAVIVVAARRWRGLTWREVRWGALLGVVLWAAYALQTVELQSTSPSNGGFITGLSVVLVPLFGLFILGQRPDRWAVIGVVMATVGLALLSLHIEERLAVSWGDALVFGCAIAF